MPIQDETGYTSVQLIEHINGGIPCEICGKVVALADTHSMVICYAMPGSGYAAYQCANEQHYACSRDHAVLASLACVFGHMLEHPHAGSDQPLGQEVADLHSRIQKYKSKSKGASNAAQVL